MTAGDDISTPGGRLGAYWRLLMTDHGILRILWHNMHEIAPGVWRSNQPSPARLRRWHQRGIRSIINLRGEVAKAHYLLEQEACADLGLNLINLRMSARRFAPPETLLKLLDLFRTIERPFVFHCKSGADRSSLAAALYLMDAEGVPVAEAKRQLSLRYLHLHFTNRGAIDHLLAAYEKDTAVRDIPIREWIETVYDHTALEAEFAASRGKAA